MLKFENVSYKYPNTNDYVLSDISFQLKEGEWLTILGSNGSGKSTIIKLISAQLEVSDGSITLFDKKYNVENIAMIFNNIAVVFQNPDNQFVGSTVEEDIAFGLENKNVEPEEMNIIIEDVLTIVDMLEYRSHEPRDLSGGQKQRVAIAAALALKPKLLILDEATSMLDPLARESILNYIKRINKDNNLTVLSITHDVEELKYSDSILLLNKGKIITKDRANNIIQNKQLLEKYELEIPLLYKLKDDINKKIGRKVFDVTDNLDVTVDKLCELILKK